METKEKKKRTDKTVQLPMAQLPGRRYEGDKPKDCRFCYFWEGRIRGCSREECWYLIPLPEEQKKEADENCLPLLDCRTCAYRKHGPCIGYCIAKIEREVFSKTRGWKLPVEAAADPDAAPAWDCGVMA